MQNISLSRILIPLAGLLVGLYVIMEALTSNTSILGRLYLFVAITAFLTGVLKPRAAIYALIFCTAYIDFFKRMMVIAGIPTNFDVACTLATPPLLCAGAVINIFLSATQGKFKLNKGLIWSFVFAVSLVLVGLLTSSGGGLRGFGGIVNSVTYPFLLVLVPVYFPCPEDKNNLMKFIYVLFLGVAVYMLKHAFYGLADFEYDYLLTNLSQEVRILWEGDNSRYFSTMNGAGIVSVMCALMFFWSVANVWKKTFLYKCFRLMAALTFVLACYYTLSRTGWVCGFVACVSYLLFKRWSTTVAAYAIGISIVISCVMFSPVIKDAKLISNAEKQLKSLVNQNDSRLDQATTLGTFNGRVEGWVNLMTKRHFWTPFGWTISGRDFDDYDLIELGDDIIFWSVVKYGYVPVFCGITIFFSFLYKLHWFVCQLSRDGIERKIANICLATSVGIISGGMSNAAQLYVFPVNVYFYLCLSFVLSIYMNHRANIKNVKSQGQYTEINLPQVAISLNR